MTMDMSGTKTSSRQKPLAQPIRAASQADHTGVARGFDIAVVGTGAVGLVAAIAFSQRGYTTALIGPFAPRDDGRTVALLDGSIRLLQSLGVWGNLEPASAPLAVMRIVDDTGSLFRTPPVSFRASEIGLNAFGKNIENIFLIKSLYEFSEKENHLTIVPELVSDIRKDTDHATLVCGSGSRIQARLVVAADGRDSKLRSAVGIPAKTWSYPQTALTAIFSHTKPHGDVSTEFHTRNGPCTLVPLPNRRSSLVWMTEPKQAAQMMTLDDKAFAESVEKQTKSILGTMQVAGSRGAVPMGGLSVSSYTAKRVALIGEAAHAFPPIGAQGLNLGLRDVEALLKAVLDEGKDPGSSATLSAYNRSRQRDVGMRTTAVDALNRSLLSPLLPVDLARGIGLVALDLIGPLRRMVMRTGLAN
jgi:2-octaprenyl-6-methoxyphenol hydroxylase